MLLKVLLERFVGQLHCAYGDPSEIDDDIQFIAIPTEEGHIVITAEEWNQTTEKVEMAQVEALL